MTLKPYKRPEKIFAGIGNRDTPPYFAELITLIGKRLHAHGYTWATGGSGNADLATMNVSMDGYLYVPWNNFSGFQMKYAIPQAAFKIASEHCPGWTKFSDGVKKLHARNMMIISGPHVNPDDAVDLVICYTRDGCDCRANRSSQTGGTGSAISYADSLDIPIINLARKNAFELLTLFTGIDFMDIEVPMDRYKDLTTVM